MLDNWFEMVWMCDICWIIGLRWCELRYAICGMVDMGWCRSMMSAGVDGVELTSDVCWTVGIGWYGLSV